MTEMRNYNPENYEELQRDLKELTTRSKIIGGGTDLIIHLNLHGIEPDALLYIGGVEKVNQIIEHEDDVEIGAACTMTMLEKSPLMNRHFRAIVDAASDVGSPQIRNHGTIGGNIANASPAADTLPVLFLLNAEVVIMGPNGLRTAPIAKTVLGPGKTSLTHQEAIVAFRIKKRNANTKNAFRKLGFRGKVTISRIGAAVELVLDKETVTVARVMIGAISLTPRRCEAAEEALLGTTLDKETIKKAGKAVSDLIMEITPEKFDRDYKVHAAKGVMEDVLLTFKVK